MTEAMGIYAHSAATRAATTPASITRTDARRTLQLVLATVWLLDGVLQLQGYFFSKAFGSQFIPMTVAGNPSLIARSITWSGATIAHHAVLADSAFALVQIAIALAIAWRPTLKLALAVSIAWAVGVWWIGEGFGGVLSGAADPVNGAPGAVIIYALLAILLWPSDRPGPRPSFIAGRTVGPSVAKALWLVLWGSLSYFAVLGANRSSRGLHYLIASLASGEPAWLASLDLHVASAVDDKGLVISITLAVLLALVAVGVCLPARFANGTLVLAVVLSLVIWIFGENLGGLFTGTGTDVNTGPLLILLSIAYWRRPAGRARTLNTSVVSSSAGI